MTGTVTKWDWGLGTAGTRGPPLVKGQGASQTRASKLALPGQWQPRDEGGGRSMRGAGRGQRPSRETQAAARGWGPRTPGGLSAWAGLDLTLRAADVTELLPTGGGNTEMTNEHLVGVSSA